MKFVIALGCGHLVGQGERGAMRQQGLLWGHSFVADENECTVDSKFGLEAGH